MNHNQLMKAILTNRAEEYRRFADQLRAPETAAIRHHLLNRAAELETEAQTYSALERARVRFAHIAYSVAFVIIGLAILAGIIALTTR